MEHTKEPWDNATTTEVPRDVLLAYIAELRQQRDELQRDAERYRWLRANWTLLRSMATRTTLTFGFEANAWADFGEPVIDAAIDSAMKEQK